MDSLKELIKSARAGDSISVEALVEKYSYTIRHECCKYALHLPADLSLADLVQEVWFRVWTKLPQFKGDELEGDTALIFEGWMRKTARSVLNDLYRNRSAQKRMPEEAIQYFDEAANAYQNYRAHEAGPSSIFAKDEDAQRLHDAMIRYCDSNTLDIVNRYISEGQSFKQIAESTGQTYEQVRYAFHTAMEELEKRLR